MKRLNGLDAYCFFTEHPSAPQHTLKIGILDCREVPGGYPTTGFSRPSKKDCTGRRPCAGG